MFPTLVRREVRGYWRGRLAYLLTSRFRSVIQLSGHSCSFISITDNLLRIAQFALTLDVKSNLTRIPRTLRAPAMEPSTTPTIALKSSPVPHVSHCSKFRYASIRQRATSTSLDSYVRLGGSSEISHSRRGAKLKATTVVLGNSEDMNDALQDVDF
jgi:hypothetical protein